MGGFVVVAKQQITRLQAQFMAEARIVEARIQLIEGLPVVVCQGFAQAGVARFDPVAHVAQGGAVGGLLEHRKTIRQALLALAAAPRGHQVAVEATMQTPQRFRLVDRQVVVHRHGGGQPGAAALRRLTHAGQAHPAGMGVPLGAVGVHRGGRPGLGHRDRPLQMARTRVAHVVQLAIGGVRRAEAPTDRQVEAPQLIFRQGAQPPDPGHAPAPLQLPPHRRQPGLQLRLVGLRQAGVGGEDPAVVACQIRRMPARESCGGQGLRQHLSHRRSRNSRCSGRPRSGPKNSGSRARCASVTPSSSSCGSRCQPASASSRK